MRKPEHSRNIYSMNHAENELRQVQAIITAAQQLTPLRDRLIIQLRDQGVRWRKISEITRLSENTLRNSAVIEKRRQKENGERD